MPNSLFVDDCWWSRKAFYQWFSLWFESKWTWL